MKVCTGIIISSRPDANYGQLTKDRPNYMIPYGGRYRMIDFSLSNMSNYHLRHVYLYAGRNVRSTLDHIGNGEDWELNRRSNGLVINPATVDELTKHTSEVQSYFDAMPYFQHLNTEHIYIEDPMVLAKVNLSDALEYYEDHDLDVMLLYKKVEDKDDIYVGEKKLILDDQGRLVNIGVNLGTSPDFNLFISRIFMKRKIFNRLVADAIETGTAKTLLEAIMNHKSSLKIGSYGVDCRVELVGDLLSYYRSNMNLLKQEVYHELFFEGGMVYTKSKDEPSTLYKESATIGNSLIANGCIIEGQVENSVLFRGVTIEKGAIVRNCILNQGTVVEKNAVVVNTITDKYAHIKAGVTIAGAANNPYVVGKDEVLENN